ESWVLSQLKKLTERTFFSTSPFTNAAAKVLIAVVASAIARSAIIEGGLFTGEIKGGSWSSLLISLIVSGKSLSKLKVEVVSKKFPRSTSDRLGAKIVGLAGKLVCWNGGVCELITLLSSLKGSKLKPRGVEERSSGRVRRGTVLKVLLDPSTIEDPKSGY